jgi:Helix-turn-helix domain
MDLADAMEERVGTRCVKALPGPVVRLATLRVRTVARILWLRRGVIYGMCRSGVFPGAYRKGGDRGEWLIPARDVDAYQQQQRAVTVAHLRRSRGA